jgi:hypothetical protein
MENCREGCRVHGGAVTHGLRVIRAVGMRQLLMGASILAATAGLGCGAASGGVRCAPLSPAGPVARPAPVEVLRSASALAASGRHADALRDYIWLLEHGVEVDPAFIGVRDSHLLVAMVALGDSYEPARVELQRRQLELETVVLKQPKEVIREKLWLYVSINEYLNDQERTKRLVHQLLSVPDSDGARRILVRHMLPSLTVEKDAAFVVESLDTVKVDLGRAKDAAIFERERLTMRVAFVYEALLSQNRVDEAWHVVDLALPAAASLEFYQALLKAAERARKLDARAPLLERAKITLSPPAFETLLRDSGAAQER